MKKIKKIIIKMIKLVTQGRILTSYTEGKNKNWYCTPKLV